jgi:hypothetical protein
MPSTSRLEVCRQFRAAVYAKPPPSGGARLRLRPLHRGPLRFSSTWAWYASSSEQLGEHPRSSLERTARWAGAARTSGGVRLEPRAAGTGVGRVGRAPCRRMPHGMADGGIVRPIFATASSTSGRLAACARSRGGAEESDMPPA